MVINIIIPTILSRRDIAGWQTPIISIFLQEVTKVAIAHVEICYSKSKDLIIFGLYVSFSPCARTRPRDCRSSSGSATRSDILLMTA